MCNDLAWACRAISIAMLHDNTMCAIGVIINGSISWSLSVAAAASGLDGPPGLFRLVSLPWRAVALLGAALGSSFGRCHCRLFGHFSY